MRKDGQISDTATNCKSIKCTIFPICEIGMINHRNEGSH